MQLRWRIEMLGGLRVFGNGQSSVQFQTRKIAGLLVTLAYRPDCPQSREVLAEQLWPDTDPEKSRLSLRVALNSLRKILEPTSEYAGKVLLSTRTHISMNAEAFSTDASEFKSLCDRAIQAKEPEARAKRVDEALSLYRGELLPGFYDDWILGEREALIETCYKALTLFAESTLVSGDSDKALFIMRRATILLPLRETAHEMLIRRYFDLGRVQQGLNQYSLLTGLLKSELNSVPSKELQTLVSSQSGNLSDVLFQNASAVSFGVKEANTAVYLPRPLTVFFGRERELEMLIALLSQEKSDSINGFERLVSIVGMGGVGKSRLAIEAASHVSSNFEITAFVTLADTHDAKTLWRKIAFALRLKLESKTDTADQVRQSLLSKSTLLVMDNVDTLLDAAEAVRDETLRFVQGALSDIPSLKILLTSRRTLNLKGEHVLYLKPLDIPSLSLPAISSKEFPAIRIFLNRASAVGADFHLNTTILSDIIKLCAKLDGIPLAIELAAAWGSVLSPAQMLNHLSKLYEFPTSHNLDLPDRHRTLRSALESSFDLLLQPLQSFMLLLSLFNGGWTAEAAGGVACEAEVLTKLAELKERSFINSYEQSGTVRFAMLERVREFCKLKLEHGVESEFNIQHLLYFSSFLEGLISREKSAFDTEALNRIEAEIGNLRLAMKTALSEETNSALSLRFAASIGLFFEMQGYLHEGADFLENALKKSCEQPESVLRASALSSQGRCRFQLSEYEKAKRCFADSLQIYRGFGDLNGAAKALGNLAVIAEIQGDYSKAEELNLESLAIRCAQNDRAGEAAALNNLGVLALQRNRLDEANRYYRSSLSIKREIGEKHAIANTLTNLGNIAHMQGNLASATHRHEESLALRRQLNDRQGIAWSLNNLGIVSFSQMDYDLAKKLFEDSLAIKRELGDQLGIAQSLQNIGKIEFEEKRIDTAYDFFYEAYAIFHTIGNRHGVESSLDNLRSIAEQETIVK